MQERKRDKDQKTSSLDKKKRKIKLNGQESKREGLTQI